MSRRCLSMTKLFPPQVKRMKEILSSPFAYRLWQAPFARWKIAPILASHDGWRPRTVLDFGCGPGKDPPLFAGCDRYVGVDLSERYISYARSLFGGEFFLADLSSGAPSDLGRFDLRSGQ